MKKYLLLFAIISMLLISACSGQPKEVRPTPQVEETVVVSDSKIKQFEMIARQWSFEPATITVKQGDTVRLNIKSEDVTHGFAISEFGVNERLLPGKTTTVEFVADKKGEYTFFCSVPCGSGHGGMRGKLIVK